MVETNKAIPVTPEGLLRLKAELEELREVKRPEIISAVAEARSHGDLRENAAYDAAREDQAKLERRISELEAMLQNAVIADQSENLTGAIRIGSKVSIDFGDGEHEAYTLVGAIEARPSVGLISTESPLGKALVGKRTGDTTYFLSPGGQQRITIISVS